MAMVRFDNDHKLQVTEDPTEVRERIVGAGAAYTPMIQLTAVGEPGEPIFINAHQIRCVTST